MQEELTKPYHYERPWARYYTVILLMVIYCFNFIDRQLLVIMQESIKADLGLSDSQLGLLSGFAFALFYVLAGIPIAHWADRAKRRNIIALAVGIWSIMTALSGMTSNFFQLLMARIGVGVGEAGCSPPAHSMISDIFKPKSRATAIAFYSIGINIGILFGFLLGGWLNETLGWRQAFLIVGLPGVLLAIIARFTLVEPRRGYTEETGVSEKAENLELVGVLKLLCSRPSFVFLALGGGLAAFAGYAGANWSASFFIRSHDMSVAEVGRWLALIIGLIGGIGIFACGIISDKLSVRDIRWYVWFPAIAILVSIPFTIASYIAHDKYHAMLYYCLPVFFSNAYIGGSIALAHQLVGIKMRALSSAIFFFVLNIIGLGLGPLAVGLVSDLLAPSMASESIRYAMLYVIPPVMVLCAFCLYLSSRYLKDDLARAPH